jgi:hypothetical protein
MPEFGSGAVSRPQSRAGSVYFLGLLLVLSGTFESEVFAHDSHLWAANAEKTARNLSPLNWALQCSQIPIKGGESFTIRSLLFCKIAV